MFFVTSKFCAELNGVYLFVSVSRLIQWQTRFFFLGGGRKRTLNAARVAKTFITPNMIPIRTSYIVRTQSTANIRYAVPLGNQSVSTLCGTSNSLYYLSTRSVLWLPSCMCDRNGTWFCSALKLSSAIPVLAYLDVRTWLWSSARKLNFVM